MIKLLLLLLVPVLVAEIVVPPEPIPNKVVVVALPVMIQFFTVLFEAAVPLVCSHITALVVPVLVLLMVIFLVAVEAGHTVLAVAPLEPSIVTYLAAFSTNNAVALLPLMVVVTPDAGFIVNVFTALAPVLLFIVIGNVSLP